MALECVCSPVARRECRRGMRQANECTLMTAQRKYGDLLRALMAGESLGRDEARAAFGAVMDGQFSEAQIAGLLVARAYRRPRRAAAPAKGPQATAVQWILRRARSPHGQSRIVSQPPVDNFETPSHRTFDAPAAPRIRWPSSSAS